MEENEISKEQEMINFKQNLIDRRTGTILDTLPTEILLEILLTMKEPVGYYKIDFKQKRDNPTDKELKNALKIIQDKNIKLKWGDIVKNNKRAFISFVFDGKELVELENIENDYGLPTQFKVWQLHPTHYFIIPANYWSSADPDFYIAWFNHKPYKNDIIRNINYGKILCGNKEKYAIYSLFEIEDKMRRIIFLPILDDEETIDDKEINDKDKIKLLKDKFKNLINSDDELIFSSSSISDYKECFNDIETLLLSEMEDEDLPPREPSFEY